MKKVAIIDKAPSNVDYSKYFTFDFDLFHMSDEPIKKLLKKDITLEFSDEGYDLVILIGSEAAKEYGKITSVTNMAGQLVNDKFVCIINPAMLIFKPAAQPEFELALNRILRIYEGNAVLSQFVKCETVTTEERALQVLYLAKHYLLNESTTRLIALDTETSALYPRDGYVLGMSLTYRSDEGYYIVSDCMTAPVLSAIQDLITISLLIVFHNGKFDRKMMEYHFGLEFKDESKLHDTMLLHYVLDENNPHGLKPLALKFTEYGDYDAELDEFKKTYCRSYGIKEEDFSYDMIPIEILGKYAAKDTAATERLFHKFMPIVEANPKLLSVYNNILMPGTWTLMRMEEEGIPFSRKRLECADNYLSTEIENAYQELYTVPNDPVGEFEAYHGKIFNPNSTQQIRELLFTFAGLEPTGKLTKAKADSTDSEVLAMLADQHPLPEKLLRLRKLTKLKSSYTTKLLAGLDKDGRARTSFNLHFTTSGRLSSSGKFNAQQTPREDPIIKGCIVAPEGHLIVSQDLQTGEMYYAAVLSGDKALQRVFQEGGDFHSAIAKTVFNLPCSVEEVKALFPIERQAAKAVSFGILYGSGADKVAESVNKSGGNMTTNDAKEVIAQYFGKFHKLKAWLDARKKFIMANGFTYSFFGRKRRLPNVFSKDSGIASHDVRSGINSEIQSLCSDINLLAAIDLEKELLANNMKSKMIMLVHDSIVAVVKENELEDYLYLCAKHTQKDRGCSIHGAPIGVDAEFGTDYSFGKFEKTYEITGNTLARL